MFHLAVRSDIDDQVVDSGRLEVRQQLRGETRSGVCTSATSSTVQGRNFSPKDRHGSKHNLSHRRRCGRPRWFGCLR